MKLMKKQSTLFPENEVKVIAELDLKEAENLACQFKAVVEAQCDRIAVAGSIRRQKQGARHRLCRGHKKRFRLAKDKRKPQTPKSQAQLLRKQRHKSVCALPKRPFPSGLLPYKTINLRNSPACPHWLG